MHEDLKNATIEIARFILIISTIAIVCLDIILFQQAYQDWLEKPWATLKGVEPRSREEFQNAIKHHGNDAYFCEWDSVVGSWVFYRDGKKCRVFKYLKKK
jgi:hypothetical protein